MLHFRDRLVKGTRVTGKEEPRVGSPGSLGYKFHAIGGQWVRTWAIPVTEIGTPCRVVTFVVVTFSVRRFKVILDSTDQILLELALIFIDCKLDVDFFLLSRTQ